MSKKKSEIKIIDHYIYYPLDKNSIINVDLQLDIIRERKTFFYNIKPIIYKVNQFISENKSKIYVFVGEVDNNVMSILDKISKNFSKDNFNINSILMKTELEVITNHFGVNYEITLGLQIENTITIDFIPILINTEDTIQIILKKIILYINNKFLEEKIFLWINLIDSKYLNLKKYNFYSRYKKKNYLYAYDLLNDIRIITNNNNISINDLGFKNNDVINLDTFDNLELINSLINFKVENLLYNIDNNKSGYTIFNNPFEDFKLNDYNENINGEIISKTKKILLDYDKIENNVINLVFYEDFKNYNKDPKILNLFKEKYWPNINKINSIENNKEILKKQKAKMNTINKISNYIFTNNSKQKIFLDHYNFYTASLKINNNLIINHKYDDNKRNLIDLEFIFNNLKLDYELPYLKFKGENYIEPKYKIYIPSTQPIINNINRKSFFWVDKDTMLNWVTGKKKNNLEEMNSSSKGIQIRLYLFKRESKTEYAYIRISKEGKIDLNLYWKEKDESTLSTIKISVEKTQKLISKINELLKYDMSNNKKKIILPNFNLESDKNINTNISSLNIKLLIKISKDLEISKIKDISEKMPFLVKLIKEKSSDTIKLLYLRVGNYEDYNDIIQWISSYFKNNNDEDYITDIIDKIQEMYNKTESEAENIYKEWKVLQDQKKNINNLNNNYKNNYRFSNFNNDNSILIIIKKEIPQIFSIRIQGIKNIKQIPYINNFIKNLFLIGIDNFEIDSIYNQDNDLEKNNIFDDDFIIYDNNIDISDDQDSIFDLSEIDYDNISENEIDKNLNYEEDNHELSNNDKMNKDNSNNNNNKSKIVDNIESLDSIRNYSVDRLIKYDKELFGLSDKQNRGYSSACQSVQNKQPIVLNQKQRDRILKEFPDSIPGGIQALRKVNDKLDDSENPDQRYYICPFIWCMKDEVSLSPKDLVTNSFGEKACPICGGIIWRKTTNITDNVSPRTLLIRDKGWDTLWKQYNDPSKEIWNSDFVLSGKWKEMYPGFIDSCLPCCQKKNSENFQKKKKKCLDGIYEVKEDETSDKYIKDSLKYPLDANKKGVIPSEELNNLFQNDLNKMFPNKKTSGILNDNIWCYLRYGIKNTYNIQDNSILKKNYDYNNNSFLYCIEHACFSKDRPKESSEENYRKFKEILVSKLTPEIFIKLNMGDLILFFNDKKRENFTNHFFNYYKLGGESSKNKIFLKFTKFINWCNQNREFIKSIYDSDFIFSLTISEYFNYKFNDLNGILKSNIVERIYQIYLSINNYKLYLLNDGYKDPVLISEYLGHKGILNSEGFSIVIFNYINDLVTLNCPLWKNKEILKNRKNLLLCLLRQNKQNKAFYEPIYCCKYNKKDQNFNYISFIGNQNDIDQLKEKKERDYISNKIHKLIIDQLNTCKIKRNMKYEDYYRDNNYIFSKSSTEILYLLLKFKSNKQENNWPNGNFYPTYQIVNNNFKSIGFIISDLSHSKDKVINKSLNNKILLPFDPSEIVDDIPIIFDISYYKPNTYRETYDTLQYISQKFSFDNSLNIEPVENIVNNSGKVYLIKIVTNNFIPVIEEKVSNNLKRISQNIDLNMELQTNYYKDIIDKREIETIKKHFESKSFLQLKYELANYLNLNNTNTNIITGQIILPKDIVKYNNDLYEVIKVNYNNTFNLKKLSDGQNINNVIQNSITLDKIRNSGNKSIIKQFINKIITSINIPEIEKVNILKNLFLTLDDEKYNKILQEFGIQIKTPIFKQISNFSVKKNNQIFYKRKQTRKICSKIEYNSKNDNCNSQTNCIVDKNRCKLFINKYNLIDPKIDNEEFYTNLIIQELLKNNFKRSEIMNNKINISSFSNLIGNENTETINESDILTKIEELYDPNISINWINPFNPKDLGNYNIEKDFLNNISLNYQWSFILDDFDYILNNNDEYNHNFSVEILFNCKIDELRRELINIYNKKDIKFLLKQYSKVDFIDYSFIKTKQQFYDYFYDKHIFNKYDIIELIKLYKKNVIILDNNNLTTHVYTYGENNDYSLLLYIFIKEDNNSIFRLLFKNGDYTFNYNDFSFQLKNHIKKGENNNLILIRE